MGHITRDYPFSKKILAIFTVSFIALGIVAGYEFYLLNNTQHDSFGLKGTFSLYENGKLVAQSDQITYLGYATLFCKLFNNSNACSNSGWYGSTGWGGGTQCNYYGSDGHAQFVNGIFVSGSLCSMLGVALTADSATPVIGGTCPSIITTNGMAPVKATTVFTTNTQSITLTASWTASGSQTFDKACLVAWNDQANTVAYESGALGVMNSFAIQQFSTQSVTSSQTWSAQWVFSA